MYDLSILGFDSFFEAQWKEYSSPSARPARVSSEHRGYYEVWSKHGPGQAELAGRLRRTLADDQLPRVGDWVALKSEPEADGLSVIEHVFQRRTVFTRGGAGKEVREQVIAANVDLVFVVCGLDGDYNLHRIERYLARIWASGAQPAVILNKTDLCDNAAERVVEVESRCPGMVVFATNATESEGIEAIRALIPAGSTAAFVGSSGAGKSTLINALIGEERMATGAVRSDDSHGRHTTTRRQLILLPGGGLLLDTPGMRELQLVDDEGLNSVFSDIAALSRDCRYRDCRHHQEPGCAVQAAVADGRLAAERFDHYRKLEREAHAFEVRHDANLQRQEKRLWKNLGREGELIRRKKEGR